MKADRGGWRLLQRNELRDALVHDTYKSQKRFLKPKHAARSAAC